MTTGITGPGGPGSPRGPDGSEAAGATAGSERIGASLAAEVERLRGAGATAPTELASLAAELDAGTITGDEAMARLVSGLGLDLGELDGAELRGLLADLLATDPYLAGLAARLGATGGSDG